MAINPLQVNTSLPTSSIANAQRLGIGPSTISLTPNGVKATAPGATTATKTSLTPAYTAPISAQTTKAPTVPSYTPPQSTAGATTPPPAPAPQSFGGIIGNLVSTAQNGSPQVTQAQSGLADAIKRQQELETGIKQQYGNIESQAIPLEFQQGREQVLARQYAGQEAAAQGAVTAAQTGVSNAYTGQGQTLGALQSAAGLAKGAPTSYGQTTYDPLTNSFGSGSGNLDPQTQAQSLAQQVMSGKLTYDQAISSMGYAGSAGTTFLNNALTSAGGNPLQLQASGAATQGVIGTQTQQQAAYQSAHQQAQNLQSQLTDLITTFGLNPSDLTSANAGIQKIAQNVSSPQYKILSNYLADVASRYAQILTPSGGSQTDTTRGVAAGMLDSVAQGKSIIDVMNALDNQAQAVIAGVNTTGAGNGGGSSGSGSALPKTWDEI